MQSNDIDATKVDMTVEVNDTGNNNNNINNNGSLPSSGSSSKSALQDNIERRGANAYYYAHSHKATGPAWDGKAEPKLLSKTTMDPKDHHKVQQGHYYYTSSGSGGFDFTQSNITTYAFMDEGPKVKLYIELEGVGELCKDEDVSLDYTETSLCLKIANYSSITAVVATPSTAPASPPPVKCLCFAKLAGPIADASFKLKTNRVILTLTKKKLKPKKQHSDDQEVEPDQQDGTVDENNDENVEEWHSITSQQR